MSTPRAELDPDRIATFAQLIVRHPKARVGSRALWAAFATAFPGRPRGADERVWFVAALETLATRGLLRLPVKGGGGWDASSGAPVPTFVVLIRSRAIVETARRWREFPWHPRLSWVADRQSLSTPQEQFLRRVHDALVAGTLAEPAPLRYRSMQLTGTERGLEHLLRTKLFSDSALTLDLLGCLPETVPLAWAPVGERSSVIVFENAGAFAVARSVLVAMAAPPYGIVAYGGGKRLPLSLPWLRHLGRPVDAIHYVGDLDADGLAIAVASASRARELGLPEIVPAPHVHAAMLRSAHTMGAPQGWPNRSRSPDADVIRSLCAFLPPDVRSTVGELLLGRRRIPEEVLGPQDLVAAWHSP